MKINYLLLIISGFYSSAYAVDVQVQINGALLAQSCNVKSSDLTKNVIFDDINPSSFTTVGATGDPKEVSIALENCTGNVNQMSYMFSGNADESNPNLLKITGTSEGSSGNLASGLAIEILDMNKKALPLNEKQSFNQVITSSTYDFKFFLRYKSTSAKISPGDASSLLYLDMYYE
ncbi:fimbrial protein [Winslowiella sp. 2C04]|uniref:fimbrial protein n=1 Tax=Winslowiella sp. 2C04 TaxID=3416179 RepID=UPI003CE777B1